MTFDSLNLVCESGRHCTYVQNCTKSNKLCALWMTFGTNYFALTKSVNYDHKISKLLFVKHYQNVHILHKNIHSTQSLINILLTHKKNKFGYFSFCASKDWFFISFDAQKN